MAGTGDALAMRGARSHLASRRGLALGLHGRSLSDGDLIELVARQDREAFAELYDRHAATSYRLALRVARNPQLAEAIVQEVFLAVWRQARRFDARRAKPTTWLLTITHHKAVDAVRSEQRRRTATEDQIVERADVSVDLAQRAWLGIEGERVARALAELPEAQREVIELAYFGGHSQSELARRLGQPIGTIKSRTRVALERLRAILEGFPRTELATGSSRTVTPTAAR